MPTNSEDSYGPAPKPVQILPPTPFPEPPTNQQPLAGLHCFPLSHGSRVLFEPLPEEGTLVLASGFDKRVPCRLRLRTPDGGWEHELNVGFCSIAQRFHIAIPAGVGELGVTALEGDASFWVLADEKELPISIPRIWPVSENVDRLSRFFDRLEHDCIAEFGWMGGCVLEAYDALALADKGSRWQEARARWLSRFMDAEHLRYQDPLGRPQIDTFNTIEATLPLATIIRNHPEHPIIDTAMEYLISRPESHITCEGCYTVAYPMMQLAVSRGREDFERLALEELMLRKENLFYEGDIYLRHHGTHRTYQSWTRGVAWYLLGFAECLSLSDQSGPWAGIAEHLAERANWAIQHQREDGLWDNFFKDPGLPPDTSGSSGIAAALLKLYQLGVVGDEAVTSAKKCWAALPGHLFVDGWLGNTSPSNKRGEEVQRGPRRASETFGMGLMGRLAGAVALAKN